MAFMLAQNCDGFDLACPRSRPFLFFRAYNLTLFSTLKTSPQGDRMQPNPDYAIQVENLNKIFFSVQGFWRQTRKRVVAVEDISFHVCRGELFGMVGPNGAGKTTTVKMLSTLLLPTSGSARVLGLDVHDTKHLRPRIGFTFGGNRGLYSRLSGLDNLKYFAELYKLDPDTISKRIKELLEIV